MIKYVLFDFDGTLIDSNEAVISSLHLAAVHHRGTPFTKDELNQILGKPIRDQMMVLSEENADALVDFYRIEYRKVRDLYTKSYEGVDEMLQAIKAKGIKMGIVSNKGRSGIDHGLEMFALHDLIDVAVSKDDVVCPKPNPEGIYKALRAMGGDEADLSSTVFVGDSGHDIETAKNAGCLSILVAWTLIDMALLTPLNPDCIAQTPDEIVRFIESI